MSNTYDDVMKDLGVSVEDEALEVESKGGRYEFKPGEYRVLIGDLAYKYTNADNKACEKTDPGAKLSYGQMDFIVIKSLGQDMLTKELELKKELPPGGYIFRQYIPFQADRQYQNKNTFEDFYIDNQPTLKVIQDVEKTFKVNFAVLPVYRGCPTSMTITEETSRAGKKYNKATFKLESHTIDKNTIETRKKMVDKLYEEINAYWEEQKASNANTEAPSETAPKLGDVDDLMENFS